MDTKAAYTTPLVPLVPMLGITFNIFLTVLLPDESLIRFAVWTGLGVLVYLLYGIHNSKIKTHL